MSAIARIHPNALYALAVVVARRRRQLGLGECPSYAPFESPGGGCSNVAPGVDAFSYYRSGGQLSDEGTVGAAAGGVPVLDCEYGSKLNMATGRTECRSQSEALYTNASGYVPRTSTNQSQMAQIAIDAEKGGRARGLSISCKVVPLGGDLLNNNQQVYGTECNVNGTPGHDGALLLTGAGFDIAAVEANTLTKGPDPGYIPMFKASDGYSYIPPTAQTGGTTGTGTTAVRASTATNTNAPVGTDNTKADPDKKPVANTGGDTGGNGTTGTTLALPPWALYAGLALIAFFLLGGRR